MLGTIFEISCSEEYLEVLEDLTLITFVSADSSKYSKKVSF